MGGSSALVIAGIWLAVLGYAVLYTGVAKTGGDSSYHLALAFQGQAPKSAPAQGGQGGPAETNWGWSQQQMLPLTPIR